MSRDADSGRTILSLLELPVKVLSSSFHVALASRDTLFFIGAILDPTWHVLEACSRVQNQNRKSNQGEKYIHD